LVSVTSQVREQFRKIHAALVLPAYRHIVRPLWDGVLGIAAQAASAWLKQFGESPLKALSALFAGLAVVAALCLVGSALLLSWLHPIVSIAIPDFEVPPGGGPVSGKTLAKLVSEELSEINETIERGDPLVSRFSHRADTEALQTEGMTIPAISGVSVWGLSPENFGALWQQLRTKQQTINGELIGTSAGVLALHAHVSTDRAKRSWEQPVAGTDYASMRRACAELAHQILSDLSPQAMGRYFLHSDQPDRALREFRRWQVLQPNDAEPLFYLGWAYDMKAESIANSNLTDGEAMSERFRQLAKKSYEAALQKDPAHAEALNALGVESDLANEYQHACDYYGAAEKNKRDDPTFLMNLGNCSAELNKYSDAFRYYRRALRRDPQFAGAWWNYGLAMEQVPDNDPSVREVLACCLRSDSLDHCKREEPRRAYETAVSLRPDLTEALIELGRTLKSAGDKERAIAVFSEAIAFRESDATYRTTHSRLRARAYDARCLTEMDEESWDAAVRDCTTATQLDPAEKSYSEHRDRGIAMVPKQPVGRGSPK
jgi:tetratricopeptide (TPR) repeat protein